jgi:fumarylacetoacetate (FAA) hydrolase
MKLATLKDGTRDGRLVVVSRDLTRFTDASYLVRTLQAAIDDWQRMAPHLETLAQSLEVGAVPSERFHEHDAASPLPRAYQHFGCGDRFDGPRDALTLPGGSGSVVATLAVVTADLDSGADAGNAVRLVMLCAGLQGADGPTRHASFSPVAVTPDELGTAWTGKVAQALAVSLNGKLQSSMALGADLNVAAATIAASGSLSAGAIIAATPGADPVSVAAGDTIRIAVKDSAGHSIFGAIERTAQA